MTGRQSWKDTAVRPALQGGVQGSVFSASGRTVQPGREVDQWQLSRVPGTAPIELLDISSSWKGIEVVDARRVARRGVYSPLYACGGSVEESKYTW